MSKNPLHQMTLFAEMLQSLLESSANINGNKCPTCEGGGDGVRWS